INIQPHLLKNLASVLMLIPDLAEWTHEEKSRLAKIIEAKARQSESLYLKLMQYHERLRAAIIQLGS
ncbi:MAG TPA: hypothetical protein VGU64_19325, partial [Terriglobales bacterium]|nr:hypothetical protein [Terriglobales bacterium]